MIYPSVQISSCQQNIYNTALPQSIFHPDKSVYPHPYLSQGLYQKTSPRREPNFRIRPYNHIQIFHRKHLSHVSLYLFPEQIRLYLLI